MKALTLRKFYDNKGIIKETASVISHSLEELGNPGGKEMLEIIFH